MTRRYVGCAKANKIRCALAHQCPWFEVAYVSAYYKLQRQPAAGPLADCVSLPSAPITGRYGRIGTVYHPTDVNPGIYLMQQFIKEIQVTPQLFAIPPALHPPEFDEWVKLERKNSYEQNTYEHAAWIHSNGLAELLGEDLHHSVIRKANLNLLSATKQHETILSTSERCVALVDEERFRELLNRCAILEQAVKQMVVRNQTSLQEQD